jgi:hypothetical protein
MSNVNFISVPFKIDDNFTQIAGVGKFSRAGIVLEYEGKMFGIIKSGVKESRIALDEVLDIKFRKGLFKRGAKIEIRLKSFTKQSEMPNKDGKISLKISRDDFERAEEAVAKLQKDLIEYQESLPPAHTPVSRLFEGDDDFETKDFESDKNKDKKRV